MFKAIIREVFTIILPKELIEIILSYVPTSAFIYKIEDNSWDHGINSIICDDKHLYVLKILRLIYTIDMETKKIQLNEDATDFRNEFIFMHKKEPRIISSSIKHIEYYARTITSSFSMETCVPDFRTDYSLDKMTFSGFRNSEEYTQLRALSLSEYDDVTSYGEHIFLTYENILYKTEIKHENKDNDLIRKEIPISMKKRERCIRLLTCKNEIIIVTGERILIINAETVKGARCHNVFFGKKILDACINTKYIFILHLECTDIVVDLYDLETFFSPKYKSDSIPKKGPKPEPIKEVERIKIVEKNRKRYSKNYILAANDEYLVISDEKHIISLNIYMIN